PGDSARAGGWGGADVDAELERVRRDHAADRAVAQAALDLAAAQGQIAAAVAADDVLAARVRRKLVLEVRRQDLRRQAALREDDQLQAALQEFDRDAARFGKIRPADAELGVDHRRVDEEEELFTAR